MKFIRQKHRNGCGIASLAMLTGSSYKQMLETIYPDRVPGADVQPINGAEHLGKVLFQLGLEVQVIDPNATKLKQIQEPLLIWLRPQNHSNIGHLAVWDPESGQILDPESGPSKRLSFYEQGSFVFIKLSAGRHISESRADKSGRAGLRS